MVGTSNALGARACYGLTVQQSIKAVSGMNPRAKLSSKYQISIPQAVRAAQAWRAGQEFVFIPKGAGVLLMPVPSLESLRGAANDASRDGYRDREDRR